MDFTPVGWQGAAAHTWTAGCDGAHPVAEPCAGTRPAAPGTAGGAQEAPTPGQAARKAWLSHWDIASERGRGTPRWDVQAYEAEAWEAAAEAATARHSLSSTGALMGDIVALREQLRQAEAQRDKLDADCTQLTATLTRLGNSHADKREALERIRDHPDGLRSDLQDIAREALGGDDA